MTDKNQCVEIECLKSKTGHKTEGGTTQVCPVNIKTGYVVRLPHAHPDCDPSDQNSEDGEGLAWTIEQRYGGIWKTTAEGISWYGRMPYGFQGNSDDLPDEKHARIFWALSTGGACPFDWGRERRYVSHDDMSVQGWFGNFSSKSGYNFLRCRAMKKSEWEYTSGGGLICLLKNWLAKGDSQNDYGISPVVSADEGKLFGGVAVTRPLVSPGNDEALEVWRLPVSTLMANMPSSFSTAATPVGLYTFATSGLEANTAQAVSGWIRLFNATLDPTEMAVGIYRMSFEAVLT